MSVTAYMVWRKVGDIDIDIDAYKDDDLLASACDAVLGVAGIPNNDVTQVDLRRDYAVVHELRRDDDGKLQLNASRTHILHRSRVVDLCPGRSIA